jgi:hypothetical protein
MLTAAAVYFPESARLNARLAQYELDDEQRDLALARSHARRAVNLSPWDFNYRLHLANIEEASGNRDAAQESLRSALALAPNNAGLHWRMANLLLRLGRPAEATDEFRKATAANSSLVAATLDLIWRSSDGSVDQVEAVTSEDPRSRLALAQFLLKQSQVAEAAKVFSSVNRQQRLQSPGASAFLRMLVDLGQSWTARELWLDTIGDDEGTGDRRSRLIWNGGFEDGAVKNFSEFDWNIIGSAYARISICSDIAHTGSHSLRIDFAGRDTTRIDGEIKQLVPVIPGRHYRLECYTKSDRLLTPEGPRLAVLDARSSNEIATSSAIPAGSNEWAVLSCEFIAPAVCGAVLIEIRRLPRFSYDDPTRGTVWFDDFALTQLEVSK